MESLLGLDIGRQLLGGGLQVTLGSGLFLGSGGDLHLGLVHFLVRELDLVLQALLQHREILGRGGLRLTGIVELSVRLVFETLQGLQDVAAVALIRRHRRSTQGLGKFIAAVIGRRRLLHERRELRGIRRADQRGMHHDVQGLDQVVRTIELHECGATLVHLTLDDAGGARDRVDGLHEFLLLRLEILLFLLTDLLCTCEVSLVRADGGNKILDL
mmetsp:Transcript_79459/g.256881  ORF Transcript_79459/g.256881 Transcript_79459/m.256881 type:complete len:215 (+) Transcript_79459:1227-1871(+)